MEAPNESEKTHLEEIQTQIRTENRAYLSSHPELNFLVSEFLNQGFGS